MEDNQTNTDFESAFAPAPTPVAAPVAPPVQQAPGKAINVITPEGDLQSIDSHSLQEAQAAGYREAAPEEVDEHFLQQRYGSTGQQLKAGLEGAASAATFGLSTGIEKAFGAKDEDIQGRKAANPISHGVGQLAGLVGSSLVAPGAGAAGVMEAAGSGAAKALGLAGAESVGAQIGSAAVKAAVENAVFQGGDEVSKMIMHDPEQSIGSAAADVGLAGLVGGVFGAGIGSVSPLWKATIGKDTHGVLNTLTQKLGGIEGAADNPIQATMNRAGVELKPEVQAMLSGDENLQQWGRVLNQSDTSSGLKMQGAVQHAYNGIEDSMVATLGKDPAKLDSIAEISEHQAGKKLAHTAADELDKAFEPIKESYGTWETKYQHLPLNESIAEKSPALMEARDKAVSTLAKRTQELSKAMKSTNPERAIEAEARLAEAQAALKKVSSEASVPGTTDNITKNIADMAQREGWAATPSSDIMKMVDTSMKEIPNLKNLRDIDSYAKNLNSIAQKNPFDGQLRRAVGMVKSVLRDEQAALLEGHIGRREGSEALLRYSRTRAAFADHAKIVDALEDRLHLKGSVSGYGKALRAAGQEDAETLLRRLARDGDADLLKTLAERLPETMKAVKQYHIDNILEKAMAKAKPGQKINTTAMRSMIEKMSPEMRAAVLDPKQVQKMDAIGELLDKLHNPKHNFSNTARVADGLLGNMAGGVTGVIAGLMTHNIGAAVGAASLPKILARDAPEAAKLALLKFLGSSKPIEPGAFATMIEGIKATIKGENALAKGTKAVFKALPKGASTIVTQPTEKDRAKLNKIVVESQTDPSSLLNVGQSTSYYMPEHGEKQAQTASNALNYLNSQRPDTTPKMPLDSKLPPEPGKLAHYNRMLDIASKPLIVLDKIRAGSITPAEIAGLKAMYPGLYNNMVQKLTNDMTDHLSKGDSIPYRTKVGLSLFAGTPLDSTMTPASILAAQPKPQPAPPQGNGQPGKPPAASSVKGISKMPASYQTAEQARAQRSQKQ